MKANIAGVKNGLRLAAHEDARRTEGMAGVEKLQRGRRRTPAVFPGRGPLDGAVVFQALESLGDSLDLFMRVEWVFVDARFLALAEHHIDRIVQHAFDEEVTEVGHQNLGIAEMAQRDGKGAYVVMVTMRQRDGIHIFTFYRGVKREGGAAFPFRVGAGVHQEAEFVHLQKPRTGADVRIRIKVNHAHTRGTKQWKLDGARGLRPAGRRPHGLMPHVRLRLRRRVGTIWTVASDWQCPAQRTEKLVRALASGKVPNQSAG